VKDPNSHHPISTNKDIAAIVATYRQSGLTLKKFAQEQGIRPGQLHYWVYQKGQEPNSGWFAEGPGVGPTVGFREVKLEAGSALLESWAAEVSVAGGLNVRFSGTARPDWIGAVVQALQRPC
jgi:transposase-like protein